MHSTVYTRMSDRYVKVVPESASPPEVMLPRSLLTKLYDLRDETLQNQARVNKIKIDLLFSATIPVQDLELVMQLSDHMVACRWERAIRLFPLAPVYLPEYPGGATFTRAWKAPKGAAWVTMKNVGDWIQGKADKMELVVHVQHYGLDAPPSLQIAPSSHSWFDVEPELEAKFIYPHSITWDATYGPILRYNREELEGRFPAPQLPKEQQPPFIALPAFVPGSARRPEVLVIDYMRTSVENIRLENAQLYVHGKRILDYLEEIMRATGRQTTRTDSFSTSHRLTPPSSRLCGHGTAQVVRRVRRNQSERQRDSICLHPVGRSTG